MEVNIKNKKYIYFKKSIIKLNDISPSLINILKEEYIGINTYHIYYYCLDNDNKLKPFYFAINDVYRYFEENNCKKYFNIDNTYNNKKILKKYMLLWYDIKDIIRDKGGNPSSDSITDNMTFKFDTDDYIPLGKVLKFDVTTLLKNVIGNDFDYYPQVYLDECKYKND